MSKLIGILGDSWGCGEWNFVRKKHSKNFQITHTGLQKYLMKEKNYRVKNFSIPNTGLMHCLDMVKQNINVIKNCDLILIFVTDTSRDIPTKEFWQNHYTVNDFKRRHKKALQHFVNVLDNFDIDNIKLIGGLSTLDDKITRNLHNIEIAFNVFDELMPHIQGYEMNFEDHLKHMPSNLDHTIIDYVYAQQKIWESMQKEQIMNPDGHHPNRHGHKIIFNRLVEKYDL
jgi:hypothetical protein